MPGREVPMGVFDGHEALHDIYPEVNYGSEKMVAHKVGKVKRRSVTSAASALTPAAGLLLAGAAVVVLGLTGAPVFELDLNDVTRTTADIDALSDLGFSDAQYPLEYRLYRVELNEAPAEDGTVYEDIMDDPRPVADKYEILEVVETGEIADPEEHLFFKDLAPGTDYLLLLYRDGEAEDVTEAYDIEMHFKTLGSGGGPAPPPPPEPDPEPDPAPEPDPEPDPEPVMFTITFANWDGSELSSAEYEKDTLAADIVRPADPTRPEDNSYTYTFAGWTPEIANVTDDATYTATYTSTAKIPRYTVRFVNWDGSVISSRTYERGTRGSGVTVPSNPTRPSADGLKYYFTGWSPEAIADVYGNATYTAQYEARTAYLITFYDEDGTVLLSDYFTPEDSLEDVAPHPTKPPEGGKKYAFGGWEPDLHEVEEDENYYAYYDVVYTITFEDHDGSIISQKDYVEGTEADEIVIPADPTRPDSGTYTYEFIGWDQDIEDVYDNATYKAEYQEKHKPLRVSITGNADYEQYASVTGSPNPGGGWFGGTVTFTDNSFFSSLRTGEPEEDEAAISVYWEGENLGVYPDDDYCTVAYGADGYVTSLQFRDLFSFDQPGAAPSGSLRVVVRYIDEFGEEASAEASTTIGVSTMALPGPITASSISATASGTSDDMFRLSVYVTINVSELNRLGSQITAGMFSAVAFENSSYSEGVQLIGVTTSADYAATAQLCFTFLVPSTVFDVNNPSVPVTVTAQYDFPHYFAADYTATIHNRQSVSFTCTNVTYEP